ncbi:hypothetical protein C4552_03145 [Candidatus Parcubacteria bacterium]|nr:MAG: hypothetical protein C4552_03145 [Candidatus Parcubacteria bacterium]
MKKISGAAGVIGFAAILAILGGGYYLYTNSISEESKAFQPPENWKTFSNRQYQITFDYPDTWTISDTLDAGPLDQEAIGDINFALAGKTEKFAQLQYYGRQNGEGDLSELRDSLLKNKQAIEIPNSNGFKIFWYKNPDEVGMGPGRGYYIFSYLDSGGIRVMHLIVFREQPELDSVLSTMR